MKLIAHRGNINGPDPENENKPEYIESAIDQGYDVEIDIRYEIFDGHFYLGHDGPQYPITWYWLASKRDNIWIHCKNIEALHRFSSETGGFNYFWHQEDDFTLTSKNYIWTYPGKPYAGKSIIVMPESEGMDWDQLRISNCYGICSDYVGKLR
jgi:hypothetical protein